MKVRDISLKDFPFQPAAMFFGRLRPGVFEREAGGFGIRIKVGESRYGGHFTVRWDYFELDSTGLITKSPRGYSKQYTNKVRILDIAEEAKVGRS